MALKIVSMLILLAGSLTAFSQGLGSGAGANAELRVRVVYEDERPVPNMVHVQLLSTQGNSVTEGFTDDSGHVSFRGVRPGSYVLRARGPDVEETSGSIFVLAPREAMHMESLYVRRRAGGSMVSSPTGQSTIHVNDLNVPPNAEKNYQKGLEALRKDAMDKAAALFEEAIAQHPKYASAYNALGVAYMRLGKHQEGRVAFEKAISLDEHFPLPYLNLGKMAMNENRIDDAVAELSKCIANDPLNPDALSRLAYLELLTGNLDDAVSNARKVHSVPHDGFESSHLIAARALRKKQMIGDAITEYKLFLREAPQSATSQQARLELADLEKQKP